MIFVPFVYFSIFFALMWRKQKSFNVGSIITLFYIISSFFAILIKTNNLWIFHFPEIKIIPTFLYCTLLTVSILPFYKFRSDKIKFITLQNSKVFIPISWILIILSFISLALTINDIKTSFTLSFGDIRNEFYQDTGSFQEFSGLPWYQYLINFAPSFSPVLLLFFFYSIVYMNNKKIFNILLILASIVLSLNSITTAARTQIIYWLFTFIAFYVCFNPQMTGAIKRKVKILFTIIGFFGIVYIVSVTISRFGERDIGSKGSFISYAGQSFPQFCNVYNKYTFDELTFDRVLPISSKYIMRNKFTNTEYREKQSMRIGAETGVFFTFLGDAMLDFGKVGMIFYTLIFYLISTYALRRSNNFVISLSQMIIFTLLLRLPLLGLFAYVYTSIQSSVLIIGSLIIAVLFKQYKLR